jgi:hypothetical protein
MAKQRYLRSGDALGDDDRVVIRGGYLDPELLRTDASRYHSIYGVYGVSVFAARDLTIDELAQQPPLVRFQVLTLMRVGVLRTAGFRLEPTGRNSQHFTVAFDDLDEGISRLSRCEHEVWPNPYHEE